MVVLERTETRKFWLRRYWKVQEEELVGLVFLSNKNPHGPVVRIDEATPRAVVIPVRVL
ncbi:hypothetical protein [Thermotoga neapolitana]|uniref:Uncharacterized protein n=1 Tax=Thermotoga neapolitana (strain ATCC 49049 / DSM 4359 / NBRC 107923 / NS-E) TaxID=309803 RepID=B9K7B7_THENN|nr:hypothetical protein [Thermotoga neapolitana]ACM22850.1 Hypothetical Protein CTN_0674 [Thermotoga neapolitana DSM 4359]KFZ22034.1 hypothetical protein LA10_03448 [Thermotoga neapolitana LA10]